MKQIIRLTESDLHKLIRESVKNVLSETSWQKSADIVDRVNYYGLDWGHIKSQLEDMINEIESSNDSGNYVDMGGQTQKMITLLQQAQQYAQRKADQADNLDSLHQDNFANQHDGQSENEYGQKISDKYDEWWNQHKDDDEYHSDDEFADTLDDNEKEYWNSGRV